MERTIGTAAKIEMETSVWISQNGTPEKDSYAFDGKVYDTEEQILVRFFQEDINTSIKYKYKDRVLTVTRKGDYETRMIFDTDKRTSCHYYTPQGEMTMDIVTSSISIADDNDNKTISLEYSLCTQDDILGRYEMIIRIKKHCDD